MLGDFFDKFPFLQACGPFHLNSLELWEMS